MKRIIFVTAVFVIAVMIWWWAGVRTTNQVTPVTGEIDGAGVKALQADSEEMVAVRGAYFNFLASPSTVSTWIKMVSGGAQQPTALNVFLAAVGISVDTGLISYLDQKEWYLYQCTSADSGSVGGGNVVLSLRFNKQLDSVDIQRRLLAWESTLVTSVSGLLFPYDLYRATPTVTGGFASAPEYTYSLLRSVPVLVEGYGQGEIGYLYSDQDLLIGGDRHCLREAEERLFEVK